jgi:hypothetical protein
MWMNNPLDSCVSAGKLICLSQDFSLAISQAISQYLEPEKFHPTTLGVHGFPLCAIIRAVSNSAAQSKRSEKFWSRYLIQ